MRRSRLAFIAFASLAFVTFGATDRATVRAQTSAPASQPTTSPADGVDEHGWTRELLQASVSMRQVSILLYMEMPNFDGRFAPDLGATLPSVRRPTPDSVRDLFVLPADRANVRGELRAEWINANTSYRYLAAGAKFDRLKGDESGTTIILHTPLDRPLKHPRHGDVIVAVFADGHAEILTLALAKPMIAESEKRLKAAAE